MNCPRCQHQTDLQNLNLVICINPDCDWDSNVDEDGFVEKSWDDVFNPSHPETTAPDQYEQLMRGRNLAILIRQYDDAIVQHLPDDSLGFKLWAVIYKRAKTVAPEYWED